MNKTNVVFTYLFGDEIEPENQFLEITDSQLKASKDYIDIICRPIKNTHFINMFQWY